MAKKIIGGILIGIILLSSSSCVRMPVGVQFVPSKYATESYKERKFEFVRSVDKTLLGFYLLGFIIVKPKHYEFLTSEINNLKDNEYITNIEIISTCGSFAHLVYIFTIPISKVHFDVVRLKEK